MPTLRWLTRDEDVRAAEKVPYRLLEEVSELGYGDRDAGNMLIQGDNLEALKALLPYYAGQVKCIYIDPPYNTGSAFEHYDENLEHSQWLAMMWPRLELLRDFLSDEGSIWINMDDDEAHYLKVMLDEVMGRRRFVATCIWQKRYSRDGRGSIGDAHESIFCYAMEPDRFKESRNFLPLSEKQQKLYKNPDNDPRGPWQSVSMLAQGYRPNQMYEIHGPDGTIHRPPEGNCWKLIEPEFKRQLEDGRITFGTGGTGVPRRKYFLSEAKGVVPWTWWPHEEVGHTGESKNEIKALFGSDVFDTPKPERLIQRIFQIAIKGDIRFSFANLMHLHRPLVIMDEAHKAGSDLSQVVYERINPTALIEFTATPKGFNNILHSVSAQELKDEEMIKMPVVLDEADTWQGAVNSAILKRAELQEYADRDRNGYIRPIVLFQAQKKNEEVTVDVLREHLIENEGIDPDKIAVATGAQRELDGINLFDLDCPIEYVITIEALKEGWDCSFAYVFCSVANIRSSTDAEQLLGRVLRMPYATRRKAAPLNKSYAKLVSKRFAEAANSLRDKLVDMGFEESEAEANIEAEQPELEDGLFGRQARRRPTLTVEIDANEDEKRSIGTVLPGKIKITAGDEGQTQVEFTGVPKPKEEERFFEAVPKRLHGVLREKLEAFKHEHADEIAPAHLGETFVVPRLMAQVQGEQVFGDTDIFMEYHDWSLADYPARLDKSELDIVETTNTFEIDLDGSRLLIASTDSSDQLTMDVDVDDWTPANLMSWLDRKVRDPWIGQVELLAWLGDVVTYLNRDRGLPLSQLMRCKFILARKLSEKIKGFRQAERDKVFELNLFGPEARVEVSFEDGFEFFDEMYADVPKYRGTKFVFRNHFMGRDEAPAFDGAEGGEEEQCALVIDGLPKLKYWTRNVARHRNSFSLPTSTDRFYPDFVALMEDGRLLVVEYKGADRTSEESRDSREKEMIGQQWAKASGGRAVFVMATILDKDVGRMRQSILDALAPEQEK